MRRLWRRFVEWLFHDEELARMRACAFEIEAMRRRLSDDWRDRELRR